MVAGDQSDPVDVLIIGGGPAGYVCALRAAQNGRQVTLVERRRVGGLCLNEGCIPSKRLAVFAAAKAHAERFGPAGMPPFRGGVDMDAFQKKRVQAIDTLVRGVESLLGAAGVTTVHGNAWFVGRTRVCVGLDEESVRYFDFRDVVIATGSTPTGLQGLPYDGEQVVEPSRALEWTVIPTRLLVAGDDYIAVELAVAYARLGSQVILATEGDRLLPDFDADLSAAAERGARSAGVEVALGADAAARAGGAERVVVCSPRRPNLDELQLAAAGIPVHRATLEVDAQLRADRHVFGIGDVTPGVPLAHRAMAQARVAGDVLGGRPAAFDPRALPRVVFAEPELASVGGTEGDFAHFPLAALGRGVLESSTTGFAKIVFDRASGVVSGAHLAGPRATDLIAEMALAIEMGATLEDLALTVHAHPTYAESVMEAAEVSLGRPIHVRPVKR